MQAIAQAVVEAARMVVRAMTVMRAYNIHRMQNIVPKIGGPVIQQSTFNWEAEDEYSELKNFIQEVKIYI